MVRQPPPRQLSSLEDSPGAFASLVFIRFTGFAYNILLHTAHFVLIRQGIPP